MISASILYTVAVGSLLTAAALVAERLFTELQWPRRGLWLASLAASVVLPLASILTALPAAEAARSPGPLARASVEESASALSGDTAVEGSPSGRTESADRIDWSSLRRWSGWLGWRGLLGLARYDELDRPLAALWMAASATLLLAYGLGAFWLGRAVRRWRRERLDGCPVSVSDRFGPAVLGWRRPRIVVPAWLLEASPTIRSMVLRHEREHIAAKDPLTLASAFLLVALVPWNVALWWQLHRLRLAVEMDCDARVVRGGTDAVAYSSVLLSVGRRRGVASLAAVALTERASQLEKRIRLLLHSRRKNARVFTALCAFASLTLLAAAWAVDPAPIVPDAAVASAAEVRREPLTGLLVGGERVVVLVEASASMLDRTEAGVERRRTLPADQQRAAPKWRQLVDMTESALAKIRPGAQFQVIAFNDEAYALIDGTDGRWLTATDALRAQAVAALRSRTVPQGESNLRAAFEAANALRPSPDAVYLLADGLPTVGRRGEVAATEQERLELLDEAVQAAPGEVPVNVILMPRDNEPAAAPGYWSLALGTHGALFAPADETPGGRVPGLPLDSERLVFVVDTSGSMHQYGWDIVRRQMAATLELYRNVRGFQVLNDEGAFLFPGSLGDWIPNVPTQRDRVLRALSTWAPFSDSEPYQGLAAALEALGESREEVALFVYGDDFPLESTDNALNAVTAANRLADTGDRKARIHAVAIPVYYQVTGQLLSSAQYASFMRELTLRNGGSFIGLPVGVPEAEPEPEPTSGGGP